MMLSLSFLFALQLVCLVGYGIFLSIMLYWAEAKLIDIYFIIA